MLFNHASQTVPCHDVPFPGMSYHASPISTVLSSPCQPSLIAPSRTATYLASQNVTRLNATNHNSPCQPYTISLDIAGPMLTNPAQTNTTALYTSATFLTSPAYVAIDANRGEL